MLSVALLPVPPNPSTICCLAEDAAPVGVCEPKANPWADYLLFRTPKSSHRPINSCPNLTSSTVYSFSGSNSVLKECNHLRHEGLRNKELYYNVFEKNHTVGASGFGSVTMRDDSTTYVNHEGSMDNSGNRPVLEEDLTPTTGARHWNNISSGTDAGLSLSRGNSGKRKQREETNEMTLMQCRK
ncbi:hypothetical protein TIFTF001_005359 [Ficus carica]|uniref:Uncharacterized protein n=1 Tax=Ficus carica TaxID=3494 RepID=A0AA87ZFW8_FICCA|nr:hypothetical protein TIFTF001_005359 [Ficus carica]